MKNLVLSAIALLCFSTANAQIPSWMPADGLVGWYPFNGNANDESNQGNNGVVWGATLATDRLGNSNSAYSFNGTNNRIEIPDAASLRVQRITMAAWVLANVTGDQQVIYKADYNTAANESYAMDMTKRFGIKSNSNCMTGGWQHRDFVAGANVGNWEFLVGTFDGTTLRSYVDGVLVSSSNYTGLIDACVGGGLRFGYGWVSFPHSFNGLLDDIAIYNRALSECEIKQLYDQNSAAVTTQPMTQTVPNASSAQFSVVTPGTGLYYQWQENSGGGFVSLSNAGVYSNTTTATLTINPVHTALNNRIYRCIIGSTTVCPDTSDEAMLKIDFTGVGEVNIYNSVIVSPNPATDILSVSIKNYDKCKYFSILNQFGQVVLQQKPRQEVTRIDIKDMPAGIYYLRIEGREGTYKIVKR